MVFDLGEIGGEGLGFKFRINKDQFAINQEDCSLNKNIEVGGSLSRVDNNVYLKGNVTTELILRCSRCLDQLISPINSRLKAHFVPSDDDPSSLGEVELRSSDIDTEIYEDKQIDLTQSIRDGILLTVPVMSLCMEDCKGICPQCGINLNQEVCECVSDPCVDPRLEVLKKLKIKLSKGG